MPLQSMAVRVKRFARACGTPTPDTTRHAEHPQGAREARSEIADAMRPVTTPTPARVRVPCGDRRRRRESARTAPIGERRHRGRAQGAAGRHGADGADAQALVVVMSGAFGSTGLGGE